MGGVGRVLENSTSCWDTLYILSPQGKINVNLQSRLLTGAFKLKGERKKINILKI